LESLMISAKIADNFFAKAQFKLRSRRADRSSDRLFRRKMHIDREQE